MSWKGFTKAVARLPARISKGVGSAQPVDEEFEQLDEQVKLLDTTARKLSTDTKAFKDSLSLMLSQQSSLAEDANDQPTRETQLVRDFAAEMKKAKEMLQNDLEQIERLVVAPTSDFINILDQVKRALTKRNHKELDYIRFGEQVKALQEKQRSVSDEKKLAQVSVEYEAATRDFMAINTQVKNDLIIFLGNKKEFIDPCLLTFYNYQVRVYQTLYSIFYELAKAKFDLSTPAYEGYEAHRDRLTQMIGRLTLNQAKPAESRNSDISRVSASTVSSHSIASRAAVVPPTTSSKKNYVVALFDYTAQAEGDLSFRKDEKIEVLRRKSDVNDWWTGKIGNQIGQFPGNYVQDVDFQ